MTPPLGPFNDENMPAKLQVWPSSFLSVSFEFGDIVGWIVGRGTGAPLKYLNARFALSLAIAAHSFIQKIDSSSVKSDNTDALSLVHLMKESKYEASDTWTVEPGGRPET